MSSWRQFKPRGAWLRSSGAKYGNVPTLYLGTNARYHGKKRMRSRLEADYANHLDLRVRLGEVLDWEYEPRYALPRPPKPKRIEIWPDFRIHFADGTIEIHECKGVETDGWVAKWGWFDDAYPELTKRLIKKVPKISVYRSYSDAFA